MINVGFTIIGGKVSWMGGINYLKNLLYAISQIDDKRLKPILFVGEKTDKKLLKEFEGLATIIQARVFDRFSLPWFLDKVLRDGFKLNPIINKLIVKYDINLFSHSFVYGSDLKCPSLNWIPDFQHVHLPQLFSKLNLLVRDYRLMSMVKYSDSILLSSYDALTDYTKFAPSYLLKASVVHFVSQTSQFSIEPMVYLQEKYKFPGGYFYLPNQFWKHKNHKIAFEAIKIAINKYPDILLICSGQMRDNRNEKYIDSLTAFISVNELGRNIKLLGLIPFKDVLLLMYYCKALINPSYFEGWSSTVEEAKSMGKFMILSDINVHREQTEGKAVYFNYNDPGLLADLFQKYWADENAGKINIAENDLLQRTKNFGEQYLEVVLKTV